MEALTEFFMMAWDESGLARLYASIKGKKDSTNLYKDIRSLYLQKFKHNGHTIISSAPIVPLNDPTTLFTSSGMQPLVPYLLGAPHSEGKRLVNSQKCFRAEDIDEIGDNRHTTFFEMLGNWSLGDYFKKEQLPWFFDFLTKDVGLDPQKLYVTVFDGDPAIGIPRDEEAIEIWKDVFAKAGIDAPFVAIGSEAQGAAKGMQGGKIFSYESKKNWWSRSGVPQNMPEGEIGGPDSEVFYDFGVPHNAAFGKECHPNCDCGRFMEIGNSVFIEYIKRGGAFEKLAQKNVDFGGGLERIAAAKGNQADVFKIGTLHSIIQELGKSTSSSYADNTRAFRIIADHVRGAVFMIADGVTPSNAEQGYFVRRLLRRAIRFSDLLMVPPATIPHLVSVIAKEYGTAYPELLKEEKRISGVIADEERKFRETLLRGIKELEKSFVKGNQLSGHDAFVLFTTYGFPIELTQEIAREKNVSIDLTSFEKEMLEHKEASRKGAEKRFKGGLADTSEATTRLHTAHHLLLKALQIVLGSHVKQRGSNITAERLRIDFSHGEKMTEEQKKEVERIVNQKIKEHLPVTVHNLDRDKAETLGAEMEFGQKYGETVSVYAIGPKGSTEHLTDAFSLEFCGGPHVENTAELEKAGTFKIQKEEASSQGVRRIKGIFV